MRRFWLSIFSLKSGRVASVGTRVIDRGLGFVGDFGLGTGGVGVVGSGLGWSRFTIS